MWRTGSSVPWYMAPCAWGMLYGECGRLRRCSAVQPWKSKVELLTQLITLPYLVICNIGRGTGLQASDALQATRPSALPAAKTRGVGSSDLRLPWPTRKRSAIPGAP